MAYDHTHVYFLNLLDESYEMDLMKVGKSGGEYTVLASRIHALDIAVDASNVYWFDLNSGAVMTISKLGGAPWALTLGCDDPHNWDIEVDLFYVYWTNPAAVMRVSKWGGIPKVLSFIEYPSSLVLDSSFVYTYSGTALGGGSMSIVKIPKVGGLPMVVAGPLDAAAVMVGVDESKVYFKTFWGGDLMRADK